MLGWGGDDGAVAHICSRSTADRKRGLLKQLIGVVAAGLIAAPLFGAVAAKAAGAPDAPVAAPRAAISDDAAVSALRDLARTLPSAQAEASAPRIKVAADSLFEALTERANSLPAQPAAAPAKPLAKGKAKAVKTVDPGEADFVGSKACMECHAKKMPEFTKTLMGRLYLQNKIQCESCHGPGSAHVKEGRGGGGIVTFRKDDPNTDPKAINQMCLGCHKRGERTHWDFSAHEKRDVACTNCHTVMKNVSAKHNLKTSFEAETCFQCHKDRRAQMFRNPHMPVREGKVTCSDCHNPHGSATEALLRTDTPNETCYKCHANLRGPFLFEHLPVRENCMNCHDPHGTVNEAMLKVARPRLCASCHGFGHGLTSGVNSTQFIGQSCQNCHVQVHGTNSPSGPLLHR